MPYTFLDLPANLSSIFLENLLANLQNKSLDDDLLAFDAQSLELRETWKVLNYGAIHWIWSAVIDGDLEVRPIHQVDSENQKFSKNVQWIRSLRSPASLRMVYRVSKCGPMSSYRCTIVPKYISEQCLAEWHRLQTKKRDHSVSTKGKEAGGTLQTPRSPERCSCFAMCADVTGVELWSTERTRRNEKY